MTNDRILMAMGIRRAALLSGMTDREIYTKLNISLSTFAKWKAADSMPSRRNLLKFCALLGVDELDVRDGYPAFAEPRDQQTA